jgi:hypothetical protein
MSLPITLFYEVKEINGGDALLEFSTLQNLHQRE